MEKVEYNRSLNRQLNIIAEKYLRDQIEAEHPEWADEKCEQYYESLLGIVQVK